MDRLGISIAVYTPAEFGVARTFTSPKVNTVVSPSCCGARVGEAATSVGEDVGVGVLDGEGAVSTAGADGLHVDPYGPEESCGFASPPVNALHPDTAAAVTAKAVPVTKRATARREGISVTSTDRLIVVDHHSPVRRLHVGVDGAAVALALVHRSRV
ncbi:hypothetical protein GCM10009753_34650 [Streptantibioticus ferralitis]